MRVEYILVSGKPIVKNYYVRDMIHKPKCLNCGTSLNGLTFRHSGKHIRLGYFCIECETVYIDKKYPKIISIRRCKIKKKVRR